MVPAVPRVLRYSAEILRTNVAKDRKGTVGPNAARYNINNTFANVMFHPMDLESDYICHSASQGISFHDALRPDTWLHCF